MSDDSEHKDLAGFVSLNQISSILKWLSRIEPCPSAYTVLCRTTLALWEKELIEVYFKQYIDHWTDVSDTDRQKTVYLMNRVRLDTGVSQDNFIAFLCTVRRKYKKCSTPDKSNRAVFLELFENLYYNRISLTQVEEVVYGYEYTHWLEKVEEIKRKKKDDCEPRTISTILDLLRDQVEGGQYEISVQLFDEIETEANKILLSIQNEVDKVSTTELENEYSRNIEEKMECLEKEYFSLLRRNGTIEEKMEWLVDKEHRVKFVANIVLVWILCTDKAGQKQVPYNTQIVSLLLFLHATDQGLLQQVKTGEGKTLIVAMLAAAKALLGYHVDVISSNRDLAQEGMRKCQPFFRMLGLQAAVNCTEDDDTNQQAYKSHIVYGDVGSFQRDVLTEECQPGGTSFSARYSDLSKNCLIVDEVDSMFLDKGQHMLYLSHETAALKHLESLFIMIWSAVLSVSQENSALPIAVIINQLVHDLTLLIDNEIISLPAYLKDFCKKKLKSWVRSAYEARFMDANDQFVIDSRDQASQVKQIFPIDKQTGIEQYNMKWTDGLSQFLELKYQRPLSTESLRAVFISNKRFFKRYDKHLFGLTGTLGSVSARSLLQNVYNIKTVEIPTNRPKRYVQTKSRVAISLKSWCELIKQDVLIAITEQPVLVICENIKLLSSVKYHIKADTNVQIVENINDSGSSSKLGMQIIDYARDGDDVEKKFHEQGGALPGQLILATNKGGRGTDIKIDETLVPKGLHVIVSFLPENTRIEEQAFGRAARAGQAGSGCLIIQIDPSDYNDILQKFGSPEAAAETLLEIEKIKRNRGETERLTILLNEGIPKLDMEEELYTSFQNHRKALADVLDDTVLFEVPIKGTKYIKQGCMTIITNQWAFWLESVRAQIRSADTLEKRQEIVKLFNEKFPCEGLSPPTLNSDSTFFKMPEDYIELGNAYLKEISHLRKQKKDNETSTRSIYKAALTCFERAKEKGDLTGLSTMTACFCFIKLNKDASKDNKKKVRCYLKQSRSHLILLKQAWMGNLEVGKSLWGLVDVSQYVGETENHYAKQIEGKLKVIGLHLNIIETLLGSSIEESSFVYKSTLKVETISEEQSKEVYHSLCDNGIICHNKICSCWKNREKQLLEKFLNDEVEPAIAQGLTDLILTKPIINEDDLLPLVYSSEELWDILETVREESQVVVIVKVEQINEKLSEEKLIISWEAFLDQIPAGEGSAPPTQYVLLSTDPVYESFQSEEYSELVSHLKSNGLCVHTQRGALKDNAGTLLETTDLGRFEQCKIHDSTGEEQSLREFLAELIPYCSHKGGYIYEHMMPFGKKSFEAKKLHIFLQEKDILKSGVMATACKYDSKMDKLESIVTKTLGEKFTKEQATFIVNVVRGLKGEVRMFERDMQIDFVSFYDLKDHPEDVPEELDFFTTWHMDHFLSLEQAGKGWWDWNAFACAMIGLAQVVAGVALVTFTAGAASFISSALIAEGLNDMIYATMAGLTGTFSWKDYAIQKAISVALTVASGGLGSLATSLKVAAKVGSAARLSTFIKTTARAAGDFAMSAVSGILSDVVLADVQKRLIEAIGNYITSNLFPMVRDLIKSHLVKIARESEDDDEFYMRSGDIIHYLKEAIDLERSQFTTVLDQLRSQVISPLTQHCRHFADSLSTSNSKWAKLVGTGAKVAFFSEKLFTLLHGGIKIAQVASGLVSLVYSTPVSESELRSEGDINMQLVDRELHKIESCFKELINKHLEQNLKRALNFAVRKSLKLFASASKHLVQTSVEKAFNGKRSSDLVKEIHEKKSKATVMRDHDYSADEGPGIREISTITDESSESKQRAYIKKRDNFQDNIVELKKRKQTIATVATSPVLTNSSAGKTSTPENDKMVSTSLQVQTSKSVVRTKVIVKRGHRKRRINCNCQGALTRTVVKTHYYSSVKVTRN